MCSKWRDDFTQFIADMGPAPSEKHTLERKDRNGNYEPKNCVWADRITQANNKCTNVSITVDDVVFTLAQFARSRGIKYGSFRHYFIKRGLPLDIAVEHATKVGVIRKRGQQRFYTKR